jgi:CheY-like chemotaxis protein
MATPHEQPSTREDRSDSFTNSQNKTILIAEDNEFNYLLMENFLTRHEYRVLHVQTGSEAVEACLTDPSIDLVLMDILMPVMNGHEALVKIKKHRPCLPVVAQSANPMLCNTMKKSRFDGQISKPFCPNGLISLLQDLLM